MRVREKEREGGERVCVEKCLHVGEWDDDFHIVTRKISRLACGVHSLVPIFVDLVGQNNNFTLLEAELTLVLWFEIVETLAGRTGSV